MCEVFSFLKLTAFPVMIIIDVNRLFNKAITIVLTLSVCVWGGGGREGVWGGGDFHCLMPQLLKTFRSRFKDL